jgi:hypothetical protein
MRARKLSDAVIAQIRAEAVARSKTLSQGQQARKHQVSKQLISQIIAGTAYPEKKKPAKGGVSGHSSMLLGDS